MIGRVYMARHFVGIEDSSEPQFVYGGWMIDAVGNWCAQQSL
jgi:hypothetical protein